MEIITATATAMKNIFFAIAVNPALLSVIAFGAIVAKAKRYR